MDRLKASINVILAKHNLYDCLSPSSWLCADYLISILIQKVDETTSGSHRELGIVSEKVETLVDHRQCMYLLSGLSRRSQRIYPAFTDGFRRQETPQVCM